MVIIIGDIWKMSMAIRGFLKMFSNGGTSGIVASGGHYGIYGGDSWESMQGYGGV